MPLLGASTRHYKAYGKRNTNVVNRTAALPAAWASESDESDESDEAAPAVTTRNPATRPPKQARVSPNQDAAKENAGATTRRRRESLRATAAVKVQESTAEGPPPPQHRRRAPLAPKSAPRPLCSEPPDSRTESSSSEPVVGVGLPKRKSLARNRHRRVVVVADEEASDSARSSFAVTPPASPSPVVSDLSCESTPAGPNSPVRSERLAPLPLLKGDRSRTRFADGTTAAVIATDTQVEEEARASEIESRQETFALRRRSRRSTAAATSSSSASSSSSRSSASNPRRLPAPTAHPVPRELAPLLPHLLSPTVYNFTSFVSAPLSPLASVSTAARTASAWWTKIGEASYSEVFATAAAQRDSAADDDDVVVVKVIPIADPRTRRVESARATADDDDELPFLSDWSAVEREIVTSRALGGPNSAVPGFVRFRG